MVHPSRYSTSGVTLAKTLVVVHTSESPPTSAASLLAAFERPGDRLIAGSNPPRYYGASYHAVTMGDGSYRQVLGAEAGPFAGPPRNKDAWHICMPGYAASTRAEWLTGLRREHVRGVARFLVDKAAGHPFPLVRIGPAELTAGGRGYCGHIDLRVYGQTDHYDPGPQFPWDVLAEDIEALTAPTPIPIPAEDDMAQVVQFEWAGNKTEPYVVAGLEARWLRPIDGAHYTDHVLLACGQTAPVTWSSAVARFYRLVGPVPTTGALQLLPEQFAFHRPDA